MTPAPWSTILPLLFLACGIPLSMAFLSEGIARLACSSPAQERFRQVARINPQAGFLSPLRKTADQALRGLWLCFITSLVQMTLGGMAQVPAQTICLGLSLITGAYLFYYGLRIVRVYRRWLDEFDQALHQGP